MEALSGSQVRVTVEDADGKTESTVIENDYILITAGDRYLDGIQIFPGTGTQILTVKRRKEVDKA